MDASETPESLQSRHRKEQRDLVARITQKKKSATKKTRKGVHDECERLEQELKERQAQEIAVLNGNNTENPTLQPEQHDTRDEEEDDQANGVEKAVESLNISENKANGPVESSPTQQIGPKKRPNRAKARLARRAANQDALVAQAAAEAASLPDVKEQERTRMKEHLSKYGLEEKPIRADGHCLYAAIADQMEAAGLGLKPRIQPKIINSEDSTLPAYKVVRLAAAEFIEQNPDEFVGFMEKPLEEYLREIRETGEWGGHMELMALARQYGVKINVLHGDGSVDKIEEDAGNKDKEEIWLGYYRHWSGLGEHYNSLRKKS
ncbi:cysteine proteinase [Zopfia rhizophila CBS 207.26]|uniref:Cysteine proteinase n=1 Tax=Zopfia rhizophila CBS 207.26 TaxID=1314779 RepID=A0A6A6DB36_9PEZI|nr:cysteine proteinase [Zopfia rhizophila CBS 207.26]